MPTHVTQYSQESEVEKDKIDDICTSDSGDKNCKQNFKETRPRKAITWKIGRRWKDNVTKQNY